MSKLGTIIDVYRDYSKPTEYALANWTVVSNSCTNSWRNSHPQVWTYQKYGYYSGQKWEHYYAALRAGELIPFLGYRRFDTEATLSGSETIIKTDCGGYTSTLDRVRLSEAAVLNEMDFMSAYSRYVTDSPSYLQAAAAAFWSGFDLGTFMAELEKSLEMIWALWKRFVDLWTMLRRRGISFDKAMDTWLEFRYAWRTFIFDLLSAHKALDEQVEVLYRVFNSRVGTNITTTAAKTFDQTFSVFKVTVNTMDTIEIGIRGHYAALVSFRNPRVYVNPIVTAWELVRFSFVIDWFLNVGTALKAFSTSCLATDDEGSIGWSISINRTVTTVDTYPISPASSVTWNVNLSNQGQMKIRTPTPLSYVPQWVNNFNIDKWFDALGLFTRSVRKFAYGR